MATPKLEQINGIFVAVWSENRRSKRKSMKTTDRELAEKRFAQWLLTGEHRSEAPAAMKLKLTVGDLWAMYWDQHVLKNSIHPETISFSWKRLAPHFARLKVADIKRETVAAYVASRQAKPATIRKELAALIAALNFCAGPRCGVIAKADVPFIELPDASLPRDRWLRMVEMGKLLSAAAALRRGPRLSRCERFLWIALETAARLQSILDLTWDRVDFETRTIHFDLPGRKQSKKRRPAVSISKALLPVLIRAYDERTSNLVMDTTAGVWDCIQVAAKVANVPGVSPHVLRHTAATHMARNGVPLWTIAKVLGNTLAVVENVYAKWCPDDPTGTVDMISNGHLRIAA